MFQDTGLKKEIIALRCAVEKLTDVIQKAFKVEEEKKQVVIDVNESTGTCPMCDSVKVTTEDVLIKDSTESSEIDKTVTIYKCMNSSCGHAWSNVPFELKQDIAENG